MSFIRVKLQNGEDIALNPALVESVEELKNSDGCRATMSSGRKHDLAGTRHNIEHALSVGASSEASAS